MKRKTKNIFKTLALSVLGVAALVGGVSLINNIVKSNANADDTVVKISPKFSIGGLNELGRYVDDDSTLYTKEAFECKGLSVDIDFDTNVQYQIFFYTEDEVFVESSEVLDTDYVISLDEDSNITHARIEITPNWEVLEVEESDRVIKWYQVNKYSKQLKLTVDKDQSVAPSTDKTTA